MGLPYNSTYPKGTSIISRFFGINKTDNYADGEFYEMSNVSSDSFPTLTSQKAWRKNEEFSLFDGKDVCVFDGNIATLSSSGGGTLYTTSGDEIMTLNYTGGTVKHYCQLNNNLFVISENNGSCKAYVITINNKTSTKTSTCTLSNALSDSEYPVSSENRIWVCSSEKNEIRSCKLGTPTAWQTYEGLASDSYTASVGISSKFTGSAAFQGYVYFFKENSFYRIYGSKPANYQITNHNVIGVKEGCHNTVRECGDYLFYLSPKGFVRFNGTTAQVISEKIGNGNTIRCTSCEVLGDRYYCWAKTDKDDKYRLYCYDTSRDLWTVSDAEGDENTRLINSLNRILLSNVGNITEIISDENTDIYSSWLLENDKPCEWFVDFATTLDDSFDPKIITKIKLNVVLKSDSVLRVYVKYDNESEYRLLREITNEEGRITQIVPMIQNRYEHMQVRLSGEGYIKLYGIVRYIEYGEK